MEGINKRKQRLKTEAITRKNTPRIVEEVIVEKVIIQEVIKEVPAKQKVTKRVVTKKDK